LVFTIRPSDEILKSQIITVITVSNINFRENGLRIRTQHGQIILGHYTRFLVFFQKFGYDGPCILGNFIEIRPTYSLRLGTPGMIQKNVHYEPIFLK
jgi:hypothetical protein